MSHQQYNDAQSTRIVEAARDLLKMFGYFVDSLWHVDDVHFICDQQNLPRLSDDEAMQVFTVAHQQFDGERGISWPELEKALRTFLQRKEVLSASCDSRSK